ncbi:hypothetical protein Bca52824_077951 [Brassica carinata]|uniref:Rab-GAP TBC domain-containing protein n=1 Tax=Brassica carinata TaxID=52824 RepID=A0A8X7PXR8_BRACI|nr:hypothetical protein Bca52824_077951 [Brassica carinata]
MDLWESWCGKFAKVASLVRDLSQPCLSQPGIQLLSIGKMLKPEKWRAFSIVMERFWFPEGAQINYLGGIDPSIRAEVWEFLLGCYALSSTSEYRSQLRKLEGSKVMDMRKSYKKEVVKESTDGSTEASVNDNEKTENQNDSSNNDTDTSHGHRRGSSNEEASVRSELRSEDEGMHSFRIDKNADLVIESSYNNNRSASIHSEIEVVHPDSVEQLSHSGSTVEIVDGLRISDVPEVPSAKENPSRGGTVTEDRMSEWLWTLHRIVVDVVRTDTHLEFYEDPRNLGRMSDILAVYAWVDPATGYCQGMSDLVSPFVVLFEDNADAFWCFEMLIRRTRANFQMEGPTGVMDQLQTLWHILQLTDKEMFSHISRIGAESLHCVRMLLVLFEGVIFDEALRMWEMMWAADFNASVAETLENDCLEPLVIQLPRQSEAEIGDPKIDDGQRNSTTSEPTSRSSDRMSKSGPLSKSTILIMNRHKIMKEARSIDDMIKIFNDKLLAIRVRRCIRTAMKLRKNTYTSCFYQNQVIKIKNHTVPDTESNHEPDSEEIQSHDENFSQKFMPWSCPLKNDY